MEELHRNLRDIENWLDQVPALTSLEGDKLMTFLVEGVMARSLYLLRVGASLAPDAMTAERGYSKHRAIIVGHIVRLAKLYDGFCLHVSKRQLELAGVFLRLIYETEIRLSYFIASNRKRATLRSYVVTSYRSERESLADLNATKRKRPLIPIEKRMMRSMIRHVRQDGITLKELAATKTWKIDGLDVRGMLQSLGRGWQYSYTFSSSSRWIHGGWLELKLYHLRGNDGWYSPRLDYGEPDPRVAAPTTVIVLETLLKYLSWSKADLLGKVSSVAKRMAILAREVDREHERRLSGATG